MELVPIQSTNLRAIGYEPDTMLMQIQFSNGSLYSYQNVEPETYQALVTSPDPGKFFAEIIKPQRYKYVFTRVV
jgi:hypothetical protein